MVCIKPQHCFSFFYFLPFLTLTVGSMVLSGLWTLLLCSVIIHCSPSPILTKVYPCTSRDPQGQAGSKSKKPASQQLHNLAGPTWSLSDPRLCTCLPLFCLFFKMLKTRNKKQIQNAVINSQFQANQASLLINLNTCKKNNKFCPSLVLRWSLLYTPCRVYACG